MKIIFLNTWNAKVRDPIAAFIKEQSRDTDIFCLQETYEDMQELAKEVFADYDKTETHKPLANGKKLQVTIYFRKTIPMLSSGAIMKNGEGLGLAVFAQFRFKDKDLSISNLHGTWLPIEKTDTEERIRQSQLLIDLFKDKDGLKVIGGDFNVLPETESVRIFEKNGYKDLVREYRIKTTRNRLAWERYPGKELYYSDYVFTSPDMKIKSFSVPNVEISDHLPLILEIE